MNLNSILLLIINCVHLMVILFVVIVPFTNSKLLLLLHSIIVPFIMFHWIINNDTCAITVMEKFMREQINGCIVSENECFSHKIIGPVYNFMNEHVDYSQWTWVMTITLWLITMYKLRFF